MEQKGPILWCQSISPIYTVDVSAHAPGRKLISCCHTYSKVRGEGPLLDWLVVSGFTSHKAEVKGQARVFHTHHHG